MEAVVREADVRDAEGIGRMHHASWVEAYSPLLPPTFWDTYPVQPRIENWRRALEQKPPEVTVMVAELDGQIIGHARVGPGRDGVAGLYLTARPRELYSLYVLADHYGSKLGQRLLNSVLEPDEPAQLWVLEGNFRARKFYERNRFVPDGTRHTFGPELGNQPEVRLVR